MRFQRDGPLIVSPRPQTYAPTTGDGQQGEQLAQPVMGGSMSIFQMKPVGFQTAEQGFNVPPETIIGDGGLGLGIRDEDQVLLRQTESHDIDGDAPPNTTRRGKDAHDAERGISEEAGRVALPWTTVQGNLGIVANPQAKGDVVFAEKAQPKCANKFSIRRQTSDPFRAKLSQEASHQSDAFFGIGIAPFIEQCPEERDGDPFIGHGEHEKIEIDRAESPIGAIQAEGPRRLKREQPHDERGNERGGDLECLEEALNPTIGRGGFAPTTERDRDLGQIHGADADDGDEKLRQKCNPGAMPIKFLG